MITKNRYLNGSITVEAAFSFTITVFVLFLMLGPLLIIKTSSDFIIELNNMSKARCNYEMIKYLARDTSIYNKIEDYVRENDINVDDVEQIEDITNQVGFLIDFSNKYDEQHSEYKNINYIYEMGNDIYDDETGIVRYDYLVDFSLPYNILHIEGVNKRLVNYRRAFIGADGNRFGTSEIDGDVVYVANNYVNSSVYHLDRNCTYLKKKTCSYRYDEIGQQRNYNNRGYSKCDYCFKKVRITRDTICYTTVYGDKFHYKSNCPLMTAYVTKIPKDYIDGYNLRPCFKCAEIEE